MQVPCLEDELASCVVLFFMMSCEIKVPIGGLDCVTLI
jgi:hypothetical protein